MNLLFIVGTGRCGSTMVQEVLARHQDVGFVSNIDDRASFINSLGRWNNTLYRRTPVRYTQRDRRRLIGSGDPPEVHFGPSEAYDLLERQISPLLGSTFRDLTAADAFPWVAKRCRAFFEERDASQGKKLFMHKFTGWPRARFLHAIFPEAQFLHIVRDGRAVANSLIQRPWWRGFKGPGEWGFGILPAAYEEEWLDSQRDFVVLAGLEWKVLMDGFEQCRAEIPAAQWNELRYEDFVEAPRERLAEVFEIVGLEWSSAFEKTFSDFVFTKGKKERYLEDLTERQIESLTKILGAHLSRLGY